MAGSNKSTDLMKNANDVTEGPASVQRTPRREGYSRWGSPPNHLHPYVCCVVCMCVWSFAIGAARESTLRGAKLSGPLTTNSYIYFTFLFFFSFLFFFYSFFFCLLCYFLSREVPSQRGRLYIFPLFLLRAGKYYYYILKKTGEREINECRRRRHSLFDSSDSFCVVLVFSTTTVPGEN